jgi:hypothetical protein
MNQRSKQQRRLGGNAVFTSLSPEISVPLAGDSHF